MNINKLLHTPLSTYEIINKLHGKVNFITYDILKDVKDIEQILKPYNKCLILILTKSPEYGHFVALYSDDKNISFFDSYGMMLDDQLKYVNPIYKKRFNSDFKHLTNLLLKSPKQIHYNEYPMQNPDYETCGYWCFVRLKYNDLSIDEFYNVFKNVDDPDKMVIKIFYSF